MQIQHNLLSMYTERQLNINNKNSAKSTERLSSGYRINRAADDAAGLTISEKMRYQLRGLAKGQENIGDGISWLQVGDGAMEEMQSMIHRISELAIQAANGSYTDSDRASINEEITQLKREINNIAGSAEFNTQDIFDNSYVSMDIDGTPDDLTVFDATYDAATGDVTYGGFIFHGERITWDSVDPGMVTTDPVTGYQTFAGGNYSFTNASGYKFNITCAEGADLPEVTRKIDISANPNGISIDGKPFPWSALTDEDDSGASAGNIHAGSWCINYEGADVAFYIPYDIHTLEDLADAINSSNNGKVTYSWHEEYVGPEEVQAVDAEVMKNLRISNALAEKLGNDYSITVRAGWDSSNNEDGIWLQNSDGSAINGSFKSWADLGIQSWDSGSSINSSYKYTYYDNDGTNDTYLAFDFKLADETSLDSVIDGLDGMKISGHDIKTNYTTNLNVTLDKNIVKAAASSNNVITFGEERELGRDFDQQTVPDVTNADISFDKTTGTASLDFLDKNNTASVISYTGNTTQVESEMEDNLKTYLSYVLKRKQQVALAGGDPQTSDLTTGSLTDLIGASNITTSGYFDNTVTIDSANMSMTDGSGWAQPGSDGKTYPTASIDFSGLGSSYQLDDLIGLGFNSTCKTCNNHYSIVFTDGASGSTTANGYDYNFKQQGQNYTLQIDIGSLKNAGITTGNGLAEAIVEITSEKFDFHYTQYAAENSKLYVYDNRAQNTGSRNATFDTAPFQAINVDEFKFTLNTSDGRNIKLNYTYDYGDIADEVIVTMKQADAGSYVKLADGTYEAYDSTKHAGVAPSDRFDMDTQYKKISDGTNAAGLNDVIDDYKFHAIDKMLTTSNLQLDANDYTQMGISGNEKQNVAIKSVFESKLVESPYDNYLYIQQSSQKDDVTKIPRFPMNTVKLRLYRANTKSIESAQKTIGYAEYALSVLSEKRSLYGAYHNRLESAYSLNAITGENLQAAESLIRDADIAAEMVQSSRNNILQQAAQSMLAQANQAPNQILNLLQ